MGIESENVSIGSCGSEMIGKIPEEADSFEYENHRVSEIDVKIVPIAEKDNEKVSFLSIFVRFSENLYKNKFMLTK